MGIPSPASSALGILTREEVERADHEADWGSRELAEQGDVTVGDYVAGRLGDAVVDRLVEPLLGGVYAGQARSLSLRACLPSVYEAARAGVSLSTAAAEAAEASAASLGPGGPVFAGLDGGVGRLAELLAEQLRGRGVVFRSSTIARELHRHPHSWSVVVGPRPQPERLAADAVVLATPAAPTGRLLAPHAPSASRALARVEYASMALVTLAVGRRGAERFPGSGFLVPPVEGRTIKACTFTSAKWVWAATAGEDLAFLRASVGRAGESSDLHRPDDELVAIAVAEVSEAIGHQLPRIVETHVQRWGGALPQYTLGHLDRVADIRGAVTGLAGLELAGAAYEGVGIPACIASGRVAARAVATHLRARAHGGGE
jgi:oxygen-dependent protoporphyrinogen oxidase